MLMRDDIKASIEAVLFVRSERVPLEELVEILDVPLLDLKEIMDELILEYNESKRGLQIIAIDKSYLLCTRPDYSDILAKMEKTVMKKLSPAAIETLAIIAYRQPVTRAEIDSIRGVKSDRVVSTLLEKDLIEEAGFKPVAGKPILYATGSGFLKVFGLTSLDDLPAVEED